MAAGCLRRKPTGQPALRPRGGEAAYEAIVGAFRKRLQEVAGFRVVPEPLPMRNSTNAVVYYLFFASQKPVADKIITAIFDKYR